MAINPMSNDMNIVQKLVIPGLDTDMDIIQKLDDEPNDVGGLTAQELKAKFDEAGNVIQRYINNTLLPKISDTVAEEEVRSQNEATRQEQETTRESNETNRQEQESCRVEAEQGRDTAEKERATAEEERISAEQERKRAETARALAENLRVEAENARSTAEKDRAAEETARQAAEAARNVWEEYNSDKAYVPGNKVAFRGSSYLCTADTAGHEPTDSTYWMLIAQKGTDGTDGIGAMAVRGTTLVLTSAGALPPSGDYTFYSGAYSAKSSLGGEDRILKTANCVMRDNVTVEPVEYTETSNNEGGTTIYLGDE